MPQFLYVWVFTLPSFWDIFAVYWILGLNVFPHTLKMLLLYRLLSYIVPGKKSVLFLSFFLFMSVICLSSLAHFKIFLFTMLLNHLMRKHFGAVFLMFLVLEFLSFLDLWMYSFHYIWKSVSRVSLTIFFYASTQPLPSWLLNIVIITVLSLVY